MSDSHRLSDLPNLDLLYHPEYQDKYVNKLRELARQHGQDLFMKSGEKLPHTFNPSINLQSISPTPSTSSNSSCGSNIRHFKKALILQSNLEDTHPATNQDQLDAEANPTASTSIDSSVIATNLSSKKEDDEDSDHQPESELSIASSSLDINKTAEPSTSKLTDFSIKSLSSSKYSSDDETHNQSSIVSKTDHESFHSEEMNLSSKDDSLKATHLNNATFDFLRPSTSGLGGAMSMSIPQMAMSASSSASVSPSASFTTLPQIPTMVGIPTHVGRKPLNGPPCSLKTLVDDGILDPLDSSLTYEILGSKFMGDLLPNGFIRMSGTSQVFANPSSWANFCRTTIPTCSKDQKNYGSAWSIIRYLGKRLDSYKLRWYRKQKKQFTGNGTSGTASVPPLTSSGGKRGASDANNMFNFNAQMLNFPGSMGNLAQFNPGGKMSRNSMEMNNFYSYMNRDRLIKLDKVSAGDQELLGENINNENEVTNFKSIDMNVKEVDLPDKTKIGAVTFHEVNCIQPFKVKVCSNVLLLVDFHSHLVTNEVEGYLAGIWDQHTGELCISQAYPLRVNKDGKENSSQISDIKKNMREKGLILVGWYHSHPKTVPQPTVGDIKRQLKYQKQMMKTAKQPYSPCVGLIVSPFGSWSTKTSTIFQMFWVMPVFALCGRNFGRPMQMAYNSPRDAFLTQDLLVEMRILATHYSSNNNFVNFNEIYRFDVTFWEKLKESLKPRLPRDLIVSEEQVSEQNLIQQQALSHFWTFLKSLLLVKDDISSS